MPITVEELLRSREVKHGKYVVRRYKCAGSNDDLEIAAAVLAETPAAHGLYPRKNDFDLRPFPGDFDMQTPETSVWQAEVRYELAEPDNDEPEEDDELGQRFSFDTTGGTRHIDEGFLLIDKQPPDAEDFGLAIRVTGDDQQQVVEGADVITGAGRFTLNAVVPEVTPEMLRTWKALTGKVNQAEFKDFEASEVLFLGVSGEGRIGRGIDCAFQFEIDSNVPALPTAGQVVIYDGHANVWVRYAPADGDEGVVPAVQGVYVVQQYLGGDFSILPV